MVHNLVKRPSRQIQAVMVVRVNMPRAIRMLGRPVAAVPAPVSLTNPADDKKLSVLEAAEEACSKTGQRFTSKFTVASSAPSLPLNTVRYSGPVRMSPD